MYILGNTLNKIKNGLIAGKSSVVVAHTNLNNNVLNVLVKEGYLKEIKVFKDGKFKYIEVFYDYDLDKLNDIKLISKPSRRVYMSLDELKSQRTKLGTTVVSTPKGVTTKADAIKNGSGGEVLFKIL